MDSISLKYDIQQKTKKLKGLNKVKINEVHTGG